MTLIIMTVIVIAFLIAGLAFFLFGIGTVLNRTANNLGDCLESVRTVVGQAQEIGPGVTRLNKSGADLLDAAPLLVKDVEALAAKLDPSAAPSPAAPATSPVAVGATAAVPAQPGVGYLDVAPRPAPAQEPDPTAGVGYLDA